MRDREGMMAGIDAGADVLVVGAGPGGAVTALLLARQGLRVGLVDRATFPRSKPCGDCLSVAATDLLARLGILEEVDGVPHAWLDGWTVTSPGGLGCTGRLAPRRGLAIERRLLDPLLRDAAIRAGARPSTALVRDLVRDPGSGRVRGVILGCAPAAEPRTMSARLVVGADGLRSVVARRLGTVRRHPRLRKLSLTAHARVSGGAPPVGRMHILSGGCVGVAPVGPDRVNLTLVVDARRAGGIGAVGRDRFFREWLARVPDVPDLGDPEVLASGPFDWPSRGAAAAGAALVGDAAGYYDPFTGQGVYHAMAAGELLAREVGPLLVARADDDALDAALSRYSAAHRRLTRPARRVQRLIEAVLSRPRLADAAIARLARSPTVLNRLLEVTGDLRPSRDLASPALLASFLIPSAVEAR